MNIYFDQNYNVFGSVSDFYLDAIIYGWLTHNSLEFHL